MTTKRKLSDVQRAEWIASEAFIEAIEKVTEWSAAKAVELSDTELPARTGDRKRADWVAAKAIELATEFVTKQVEYDRADYIIEDAEGMARNFVAKTPAKRKAALKAWASA